MNLGVIAGAAITVIVVFRPSHASCSSSLNPEPIIRLKILICGSLLC